METKEKKKIYTEPNSEVVLVCSENVLTASPNQAPENGIGVMRLTGMFEGEE